MRGTVFVLVLLAACTAEPVRESTPDSITTSSSVRPAGSAASPSASAGPNHGASIRCPVTLPNGENPPGRHSRFSHGNGLLWIELYPHGIVRTRTDDVRPDGSLAVKFPWTRGVEGRLTISGHRLDAAAAPARAWVPAGYGRSGLQSSAVIFPTAGCWEVTGLVGRDLLTIITKVIRPAAS